MKLQLLLLISLSFLILGFGNPNKKIATNKNLRKKFTQDEILFLQNILKFFDELMVGYTRIVQIDIAYKSYLDSLDHNKSFEDYDEKIAFGKNKVDSFVAMYENSSEFKVLFKKEYYLNRDRTDSVSFCYIP